MSNDSKKTNEELLEKQGSALSHLVKHSGLTVVEIAKRIGVDRQTIYLWMRGKVAIPEEKLNILAKLFGVQPAEIRYDVSLFNEDDLIYVVRLLELNLNAMGINIGPEQKARMIAVLYETMQEHKRALHKSFTKNSFEKSAVKIIELSAKTAMTD